MKIQTLLRLGATLAVLAAAIVLARILWVDYMYSPWTRDGRVRAQVVNVAPDVAGLVDQVQVLDNQQVRKGQVLFVIDQRRFHQAQAQALAELARSQALLGQAQAQQAQARSAWAMRQDQARRRAKLGNEVVTDEARADYQSQAMQAQAAYQAAQSGLQAAQASVQAAQAAADTAALNLQRSVVRAPADGYVTNLNLYPGDYVAAGEARMALIDEHSFWVYGYFEETKLPAVRIGDRAQVRLMAGGQELQGRVESMARGIADRDNPSSQGNLLADVDPIFTWVRLAQRVPVRIRLDPPPPGVHLVMGMTCTVSLLPSGNRDATVLAER